MKRTIINPVIKDTVTFLQTRAESGGQFTRIEISLEPGGGNTLHYHKTYSETFTAVQGDLGIRIGKDRTIIIRPGESFTVVPMIHHCFFNPGNTAIKFRVTIEPGHEGFEKSLQILYGMAADGLTDDQSIPKKLSHKAIVVCMSDMNAPGLLTFIYPLLKGLANRARKNGEEAKLIERYCF